MKKIYLFPALALLLTACANDNLNVAPEEGSHGEMTTGEASGYLRVKIVSPSSAISRASYEQNNGTYEDGVASENQVNLVRFYFFGEGGAAAQVRKNPHAGDETSYYSFIDWTPSPVDTETGGADQPSTVEKTLTTTLVLSRPASGVEPTKILAVVNPTNAILQNTNNLNLENVQALYQNYLTDATGNSLTSSNFVMSNSVYAKSLEAGAAMSGVYATEISADQITDDPEEASEDPVEIFVERVVAKVAFSIDKTAVNAENNIYPITPTNADGFTFNPTNVPGTTTQTAQQINVQILGWALCSFPNMSRLLKDIVPSWKADLFNVTGQPWNSTDYFRSFWALNLPETTEGYNYTWYTFNQIGNKNASSTLPGNPLSVPYVYTQENANPVAADVPQLEGVPFNVVDGYAPLKPTQVIFVGQLVDESNNPITVCSFQGKQFTEEGLLTYVASLLDMWTPASTTDPSAGYNRISKDDLKLITQSAWLGGAVNLETPGRYYSYFTLSTTGTAKTWYSQATPGNYAEIPANNINTYIDQSLGYSHAKVWENGMTYYFFDIKHIPGALDPEVTSPAYYGIVRNHIYQTSVTNIGGLGTPVLDPNEVIYPEYPEPDANNLQTVIKILSWRLVNSSYEVNW